MSSLVIKTQRLLLTISFISALCRCGAYLCSKSIDVHTRCCHKRMGIRDNVSADEYAKLEALAAANKDEWEALLQEKRNHWKELKEKGMLEKLTSKDVYMEDIDEIEDYGEQLIRSRKGSLKGALWDDEEEEEETINPIKKELIEKMKIVTGKQGSALAIYNLLNEMKDKGLLDATLVEEAILSMTKHDSDHYAVSSYKLHKKVTSVFGTISCTKSHQYADSIFLFLFCAQICANLTLNPISVHLFIVFA